MAILEPPAELFLTDHGVPVVIGGVETVGILDAPTVYVTDDRAISSDYQLMVTAAAGGSLRYGAAVTVNGLNYTVRDNMVLDDGTFVVLQLELNATPGPIGTGLTTDGGVFITTLAGDYLVTI